MEISKDAQQKIRKDMEQSLKKHLDSVFKYGFDNKATIRLILEADLSVYTKAPPFKICGTDGKVIQACQDYCVPGGTVKLKGNNLYEAAWEQLYSTEDFGGCPVYVPGVLPSPVIYGAYFSSYNRVSFNTKDIQVRGATLVGMSLNCDELTEWLGGKKYPIRINKDTGERTVRFHLDSGTWIEFPEGTDICITECCGVPKPSYITRTPDDFGKPRDWGDGSDPMKIGNY